MQNTNIFREREYQFQNNELIAYPKLSKLLKHGYNFTVLIQERSSLSATPSTFTLISEYFCSNGAEIQRSATVLTPQFVSLSDLEKFINENFLDVIQKAIFSPRKSL